MTFYGFFRVVAHVFSNTVVYTECSTEFPARHL